MLGVIIGVGAVVAMMSIGFGAQEAVVESIQGIGPNLIMVMPGGMDLEEGFSPPFASGRERSLKIEDAQAIGRQAELITGVAPVILNSSVVSYLNKNTQVTVYATSEDAPRVYNLEVERGDFFSSSDVVNSSNVAVIGHTVIKRLFGRIDPIGKIIKIDGRNFRVIGILKPRGTNMFGQDQDDSISIPITTAKNKLYGMDHVNFIIAQSKSEDVIDEASEEIKTILRRQHNIRPKESDDFTVQTQTQILEIMGTITNIFTFTISGIAAISLLVGGIGIMNIMLVSVTERTREIGIRKAVGAKNKDILIQFLIESVVLSFTGGLIGIVFAAAVSTILNRFTPLSTAISPLSIILALSFSTAVGLFFGIYPATRAARLNPIDALRYE